MSELKFTRVNNEKYNTTTINSSVYMPGVAQFFKTKLTLHKLLTRLTLLKMPRSYINSFTHSLIHSFIHSHIHSFTHSFIHTFTHSFI